MGSLMERTTDASILDFTTIGEGPSHVATKCFSGKKAICLTGDHEQFPFYGEHFFLTGFEPF